MAINFFKENLIDILIHSFFFNFFIYSLFISFRYDKLDQNNISYINWAIDNKGEKSAALQSNATPADVCTDSKDSESGTFVKTMMRKKNPKPSGCWRSSRWCGKEKKTIKSDGKRQIIIIILIHWLYSQIIFTLFNFENRSINISIIFSKKFFGFFSLFKCDVHFLPLLYLWWKNKCFFWKIF